MNPSSVTLVAFWNKRSSLFDLWSIVFAFTFTAGTSGCSEDGGAVGAAPTGTSGNDESDKDEDSSSEPDDGEVDETPSESGAGPDDGAPDSGAPSSKDSEGTEGSTGEGSSETGTSTDTTGEMEEPACIDPKVDCEAPTEECVEVYCDDEGECAERGTTGPDSTPWGEWGECAYSDECTEVGARTRTRVRCVDGDEVEEKNDEPCERETDGLVLSDWNDAGECVALAGNACEGTKAWERSLCQEGVATTQTEKRVCVVSEMACADVTKPSERKYCKAECSNDSQCRKEGLEACVEGLCQTTGCSDDSSCWMGTVCRESEEESLDLRWCVEECSEASDCGFGVAPFVAENYACEDGGCRFLGCKSDDECMGENVCRFLGGSIARCAPPCVEASDCKITDGPPYGTDNYQCIAGACLHIGCTESSSCQPNHSCG